MAARADDSQGDSHEGGPLAGRPVTSSRIKSFLAMDDAQLMADIENRYWTAKANLPPEKRAGFLKDLRMTPDDIVKQVLRTLPQTTKQSFRTTKLLPTRA